MKKYYFKFVVPGHYAREFSRYRYASRWARKLKEKIYLTIFAKDNPYREPYYEKVITSYKQVKPTRRELIRCFNEFRK